MSVPNFKILGPVVTEKSLMKKKKKFSHTHCYGKETNPLHNLGPVVQSIVSLTSSLRVISLTVLADSIHNILIFFAEKM